MSVRAIVRSVFFLFAFHLTSLSQAEGLADIIELHSENYSTNLQTQKTELEGNVHLKLGDRELFADKLSLDVTSGEVECIGKVVFTQPGLKIEAGGVRFNMKTGLGIFFNATVKREGAFYLEGKEIRRETEKVFVSKVAKISFCQDCPQSWSLVGDRIRVNTERYAEVHHAVLEIKDVPVFYLPVVYYPAQDKRFSGFLIPYFKFSAALGAQVGIPFYYAASDSMDFTWDYRYMSRGGHRNQLESRMKFSEYSYWKSNTSWIRTPANSQWYQDRYGIHYEGRAQFFSNWAFLARGDYVSDVEMSENFEDDSPESRFPTLSNDLFLESQYENFSLFAGVRMPQDNLNRDLSSRGNASWVAPHIKAGIPLTPIIRNSLLGSVRLEELSVRRLEDGDLSGALVRDPDSNFISSGDRYTGIANVSLPISFDYVRSISRAQYRGDFYQFHSGISPENASKSNFVFQQALEGDIWKIWEMDSKSVSKIKHVITPFVEYSYSPPELRSNHEFFKDCPGPGPCTTTATRFDLNDSGLLNEELRLGTEEAEKRLREHHLIDYGFKTRLLAKYSDSEIREILYLKIAHQYDMMNDKTGKILFTAKGYYSELQLSSQLAWDYHKPEINMQNDIFWDKRLFSILFYQTIRPDTDNIGAEVRLKKVGPFELAGNLNYDRKENQLLEQKYFLSYTSFSKCWKFDFGLKRRLGDNDFEYSPSIQVVYSDVVKNRDTLFDPRQPN
jgi:lipopolysaccharide assembly outer membrane protein LptD (OstA)